MNILGGKITILYGDNSFARTSRLREVVSSAEKSGFEVEKIDADGLSVGDFLSHISGVSLFAEKRFVIFRSLSENRDVWGAFEKLAERVSTDVHLCIVEEKIDKRSSLYKSLAKTVDFIEFKSTDAKKSGDLAEFARKVAKSHGLSMGLADANFLVSWVGADEWAIKNSIEKLAIIGKTDQDSIKKYMSHNISGNSFVVFEMALRGDVSAVLSEVQKLKSGGDDEGYQFFGLLVSQFFNLVALKMGKSSGRTTAQIAKDVGVNVWSLGKMEVFERGVSREKMAEISEKLSRADFESKNSSGNIWEIIESTLLEIVDVVS